MGARGVKDGGGEGLKRGLQLGLDAKQAHGARVAGRLFQNGCEPGKVAQVWAKVRQNLGFHRRERGAGGIVGGRVGGAVPRGARPAGCGRWSRRDRPIGDNGRGFRWIRAYGGPKKGELGGMGRPKGHGASPAG